MANLFPEDALSSLASGIDAETAAASDSTEVSFGRSWRFDYQAGDFVRTPAGKVATAEGTDAWLEWCAKALQTERYKYLIYSRNYGQELESLIGSALNRAAIESEISRMAAEALLSDPRTAAVENFRFDWGRDYCTFTCAVTSVHEDSGTVQGSVVTMA